MESLQILALALGAAWASFTWLIVHMLQRRKAKGLPWQAREAGR